MPRRPRSRPDRPVVVLESFRAPRPWTSPYLIQLWRSFPPEVEALHFSWRRALLADVDVVHVHWPDVLLRGPTRWRSLLRRVLFLAMLLRLRLTRRALVRTAHDLVPHEETTRVERLLMELCDRWTTLWIAPSARARPAVEAPVVVIPLGHFRDWNRPAPGDPTEPVAGRVLHFGRMRRYKGVDELVARFAELDDPSLSLHVVGEIEDPGLAPELLDAARRDPRIRVVDERVPDDRLTREVLEAQLVVLPYAEITNSSSVVLALSLDRPVLAPDAPSILELADEAGPGWVMTYRPPLTASLLVDALAAAVGCDGRPDLSARDWDAIGRRHAEAFRLADRLARGAPA